MYGGTTMRLTICPPAPGLSPCVWGHQYQGTSSKKAIGSIPMCMGAPLNRFSSFSNRWVYPHVYGGTWEKDYFTSALPGLSPCVWGHLGDYTGFINIRGSIPMCMGAPFSVCHRALSGRVYPHVYGGTLSHGGQLNVTRGLSPCVWGHL